MNQRIIITAVAPDRSGIVRKLTSLIRECSAELIECRMIALESDFAIQALVAGNWHTLSRLEKELVANDGGAEISFRQTQPRETGAEILPYNVDAITLQQTDVVASFVEFFTARQIEIVELSTSVFTPQKTHTNLSSVQMTVNVPSDIQISVLRDEFMDFCDSLNVDANLEPVLN